MGAFFVNIIFTRNPPTCIAYRHCHFSLFSSFYYLLSLSPLQSRSTSTCPLCAPNYSIKQTLYGPVHKPPVGLSRFISISHSPCTCWYPPSSVTSAYFQVGRKERTYLYCIQGSRADKSPAWDRRDRSFNVYRSARRANSM